ncbi:DUF1572 domain-containing protein [Sinomicrobium pectinilyticum]|uniref:DUF1572 domain-containing protein n=1 Tax=Sinomicrobium pectinilyticum TaxID=1084421 RepID=A0A3N0DHS6_SINP1|nr:DUF1572 family protein [Sinomicrobium pectinilyticum]RNL75228.1 DUF1572 domain-containing protein [Sinomicrobium pectinilyticum]
MKEALIELFRQDLNRVKQEIELYNNESALWKIEHSIKNSGGNLCLHIIGNLKTFIGNGLAEIGYVRQRDLEFSAKNVDRAKMYAEIDETIEIVSQGIGKLKEDQIKGDFPMLIGGKETGMAFTLIRLHAHLNYHLGQINYHRRILDRN